MIKIEKSRTLSGFFYDFDLLLLVLIQGWQRFYLWGCIASRWFVYVSSPGTSLSTGEGASEINQRLSPGDGPPLSGAPSPL